MENDANDLEDEHFQILRVIVDLCPKFHRSSENAATVVEQNMARGPGCGDWCAIYGGKVY